MTEWQPGDEYPFQGMLFEDFNDYQDFTTTTNITGTSLNPILGLVGEIGEIYEKLKKYSRPEQLEQIILPELPEELREALAKELGDVLWYASCFAKKLGYKLGDVARMNVEKLSDRKTRGKLYGSGDNR